MGLLINCRVCGNNVSKNANSCPSCGEPNFRPFRVITRSKKCDNCDGTGLLKNVSVTIGPPHSRHQSTRWVSSNDYRERVGNGTISGGSYKGCERCNSTGTVDYNETVYD